MISIIIPVYNQKKYLAKCLDSILAQTEKKYEVILIDDYSEDDSKKIAKDYIEKFKEKEIPYKIIEHDINKGAPYARNHGFQASKGNFLLFTDADSILTKNMLWDMLNTLNSQENTSFVYSSFFWGRKSFRLMPFSSKKLRKMPYIHTMSMIRAKDFPRHGWDESIKKLQDWDLWLTMVEEGKKGFFIDKFLFKVHPGGTMSNWLPRIAYKMLPFIPSVRKYNKAVKVIQEKHHLCKV